MKPNVGEKERLFRTLLGVYGILLGFFFIQGVVGIIIGIISIISLFTGLSGWCLIYHLMGKSTLKETSDAKEE
jgi:hypothetical protein